MTHTQKKKEAESDRTTSFTGFIMVCATWHGFLRLILR